MRQETGLYPTGTSNDYVDVPTGEIVRFQVEEFDLPKIPVPSLAPADTLDEAISAASTATKLYASARSSTLDVGRARGSPLVDCASPKIKQLEYSRFG